MSTPPARLGPAAPDGARWRGPACVSIAVALVIACGPPDATPAPAHESTTDAGSQRILCLGHELAALLVELGLSPRVVAADTPSLELPALAHALDAGDAAAPRVDVVARARPDIALVLTEDPSLRIGDLPVHRFAPTDANGVIEAIHRVGDLTGVPLRASAVAARLTREIGEIAMRRDGLPRLRVVWLLGRDPLVAVGGTGLLHELLELAGAENAFHTPEDPRVVVTVEQVDTTHPDLVLGEDVPVDPSLSALPALDLLGRVRALHALLYPAAEPLPSARDQ